MANNTNNTTDATTSPNPEAIRLGKEITERLKEVAAKQTQVNSAANEAIKIILSSDDSTWERFFKMTLNWAIAFVAYNVSGSRLMLAAPAPLAAGYLVSRAIVTGLGVRAWITATRN